MGGSNSRDSSPSEHRSQEEEEDEDDVGGGDALGGMRSSPAGRPRGRRGDRQAERLAASAGGSGLPRLHATPLHPRHPQQPVGPRRRRRELQEEVLGSGRRPRRRRRRSNNRQDFDGGATGSDESEDRLGAHRLHRDDRPSSSRRRRHRRRHHRQEVDEDDDEHVHGHEHRQPHRHHAEKEDATPSEDEAGSGGDDDPSLFPSTSIGAKSKFKSSRRLQEQQRSSPAALPNIDSSSKAGGPAGEDQDEEEAVDYDDDVDHVCLASAEGQHEMVVRHLRDRIRLAQSLPEWRESEAALEQERLETSTDFRVRLDGGESGLLRGDEADMVFQLRLLVDRSGKFYPALALSYFGAGRREVSVRAAFFLRDADGNSALAEKASHVFKRSNRRPLELRGCQWPGIVRRERQGGQQQQQGSGLIGPATKRAGGGGGEAEPTGSRAAADAVLPHGHLRVCVSLVAHVDVLLGKREGQDYFAEEKD